MGVAMREDGALERAKIPDGPVSVLTRMDDVFGKHNADNRPVVFGLGGHLRCSPPIVRILFAGPSLSDPFRVKQRS
jgi:hypothetical protein